MQLDLGLGGAQEMRRDAVLSADDRCRYRLTRWWGWTRIERKGGNSHLV
jgi:hypothetical protein